MTYAELRTYVLNRLTISTAETARITQVNTAINQARYRLSAQFRLKKATTTLDFVADTETVTLPSDVVEILGIYTSDWLLQPITEQEFAELTSVNTTIGPQVYIVDGSSTTLRLRPIPSESETGALSVSYVQRPAALSADSDTPSEMPAEFHDLIAEEAISKIAMSEEDFDLARGAAVVAAQLTEGLRSYMNRRAGGTVARQVMRGFSR